MKLIIKDVLTCWYDLFSSQLYLSTRRGAWILNRVGDNGLPLDLIFNRVTDFLRTILPFSFFCGVGERHLNQRFDHTLYNLKPKHRYCICIWYFFVFVFLTVEATALIAQKS